MYGRPASLTPPSIIRAMLGWRDGDSLAFAQEQALFAVRVKSAPQKFQRDVLSKPSTGTLGARNTGRRAAFAEHRTMLEQPDAVPINPSGSRVRPDRCASRARRCRGIEKSARVVFGEKTQQRLALRGIFDARREPRFAFERVLSLDQLIERVAQPRAGIARRFALVPSSQFDLEKRARETPVAIDRAPRHVERSAICSGVSPAK